MFNQESLEAVQSKVQEVPENGWAITHVGRNSDPGLGAYHGLPVGIGAIDAANRRVFIQGIVDIWTGEVQSAWARTIAMGTGGVTGGPVIELFNSLRQGMVRDRLSEATLPTQLSEAPLDDELRRIFIVQPDDWEIYDANLADDGRQVALRLLVSLPEGSQVWWTLTMDPLAGSVSSADLKVFNNKDNPGVTGDAALALFKELRAHIIEQRSRPAARLSFADLTAPSPTAGG